MAKTPKRLTKRERKALEGKGNTFAPNAHIHCIDCGKHLSPSSFTATPSAARWLRCDHGKRFAACTGCVAGGRRRLAEHERSGRAVAVAQAWH